VKTGLDAWLARTVSLSKPSPVWTKRVGGQPSSAAVAGGSVVVMMRGTVEAHDRSDGRVLWSKDADWGAVAGAGDGTVVLLGHHGHGYDVVSPASGTTRWSDGSAIGAWTYRDAVLSLTCPQLLTDCALTAHAPADGGVRWRSTMPGIGRVLAGVNSPLLGSRELAGAYHSLAAVPVDLPPVLGFPVDQRVTVVDTATGRRLRQEAPSATTRVVVIGGRILTSTASPHDGNCRFSLTARDPATGRTVWHRDGYDLGTASGAGCEQRRDPGGGGGVLAATRGDNREVLLSARDGRELWVGASGDTVLATDGRYAAVRTADKRRIEAVDLASGATAWARPADPHADVAVTRDAVLVTTPATGRLDALEPGSGRPIVGVESTASVLGVGADGLVLGRGRTIGYVTFGTVGAA
jgi:outer membrane protein assembly factor BamB